MQPLYQSGPSPDRWATLNGILTDRGLSLLVLVQMRLPEHRGRETTAHATKGQADKAKNLQCVASKHKSSEAMPKNVS